MSNEIDPIQYGKLIAQVQNLQDKVENLETDIKTLLELANRSKGGFWAGMTIASFLGGLVTFFMHNILNK
ncbi:hypothetical protein UFOVP89_56 [uncultured Caudovirales phage]|uniref:Uncharacterized protein n=1 Tax=uncultured Caudovirales phage TaxID=2100421 RepID=A0A6J5KVB3_9CAUD|nr:hypothetical protein UFOVP89_56 [uncultured Caudovirales phage]